MQSAKALSTITRTDPQMALPQFPKLAEDLHPIWVNSEMMLIIGGANEVIMRGQSVKRLLPRLFAYLNGQYTLDDIVFHLAEFSEDTIHDALAILYMRGVIINGCPDVVVDEKIAKALESQSLFYGRYVDLTRFSRSPQEVISKLQASHISLVGQGRGAQGVMRELMLMGVGKLTVLPLDSATQWGRYAQQSKFTNIVWTEDTRTLPIDDTHLLLYISDTPSQNLLNQLNHLATQHHVPLLVAHLSETHTHIGHIYYPGQSACYDCAQRQGAFVWDEGVKLDEAPFTWEDWISPDMQIGIGKTALCALSVVTRLIKPNAMETFARGTQDFDWQIHSVHLLTGCPHCQTGIHIAGDVLLGQTHHESLSALYHQNVRIHAFQANPKEHQIHYSPDVQQTMRQAQKEYNGAKRIILPTPTFTESFYQPYHQPVVAQPTPHINLANLSTLLRTVAEIQIVEENGVQRQQRTTASGGGMISQNLYVVNWGIDGLDRGLYYFSPSGVLEIIHQHDIQTQLRACFPDTTLFPQDTLAAVVQTNALARLESKYGSRAFLYAMLDAGVIAHSLTYISQLLHIPLWQTVNFYDDSLNALLGLYSANEMVSSVFFLGGRIV